MKVPTIIPFPEISAARERIQEAILPTPLTFSHRFSKRFGREVYIKWDNALRTGSFKERGALNFLSKLSKEEKNRGVCAASAGNHALAVAYHCREQEIPCSLFMPLRAPLVKVQTATSFGAEVTLHGELLRDSYAQALLMSKQEKRVFVPGYDHRDIIAGAGVSGVEISEQLEEFDSVIVPIGGGGLVAGIASAIRALRKDIFILGVRSEWSSQQHDGEDARFVSTPLADGIAVKELGTIPKRIIQEQVDQIVSVRENTIADAVIAYLYEERSVIEGAGAAALAALLEGHLPERCKRVVLLACGSNIDLHVLGKLIQRSQYERGQLLRVRVSVPDRPGSLARLTEIIASESANVLETSHERGFSREPGNVDITFLLETRDKEHQSSLITRFAKLDLHPLQL
ncbi:pyridoxal-phosphate dependent enzyme [bacterium]|nr:pyridoxal-phosphate dependent enzyme [bacterium]